MAILELESKEGERFRLIRSTSKVSRAAKLEQVEWIGINFPPEVRLTLELDCLVTSNGACAVVDFFYQNRSRFLTALRFGPVVPLENLPSDFVISTADAITGLWGQSFGQELAILWAPKTQIVIDLSDGAESVILTLAGHRREMPQNLLSDLKSKITQLWLQPQSA